MIHHITPRVDAAHAHTGVGALEVDAGQARGTLAVNDTLWSTAGGSTDITWTKREMSQVLIHSHGQGELEGGETSYISK